MISESIEILPEISAPSNPFPGLRSFELHESHLFFGRDEQRERLVSKLAAARFVAVVGASGSGKSSLVRAGLMPALLGGMMVTAGSNWRLAVFRPGNDPIGNLARALNSPRVFGSDDEQNAAIQTDLTEATLRRGNRGLVDAARQAAMPEADNLLVVVDQFEELFRFAREVESEQFDNDAAAFVKLLLEARQQRELNIFVALTMRSDFLGDCSRFWELPEAINESQYLIPRLTRGQLRQAITGPVRVARADMTTSLVNRVLNDIGDDQDQLPILQHALMRTWQEWKERRLWVDVEDAGRIAVKRPHLEVHRGDDLDLCCYEAAGGMAGALSRHADEALAELKDDRRREIAEKLFKRLTEKGEDNREIRRPATLGEICEVTEATEDQVVDVIDAFRSPDRSFLMPPAETRLDSKTMIDISHESLIRVWQKLKEWVEKESDSAKQYKRLDQTAVLHKAKRADLMRGTELQFALEWSERERPKQAWARRYGRNYDLAMSFLEQSRQAAEAETQEKLRQHQRELKRTRNFALVLSLAFLAASAMALYANKQRKSVIEGERISRRLNYVANMQLAGKLVDERNYARSNELLDLSLPGSSGVAVEDVRSFYWYYLWRLGHDEQATLKGHEDFVYSVAFMPDGRLLASGSRDGMVKLWDVQTKKEVATLGGHENSVTSVSFTADGRILASASWDKTVRLWDVLTKQELATFKGHEDAVCSVAFTADGRLMATGSRDKTVKLWDVQTKLELATLKGHDDVVYSVAFSSDNRLLASGGRDDTVRLWDVRTGEEVATLLGHEKDVYSVAFQPDGRLLASASDDGTIKLWDVGTKQEVATLKGHEGPVLSVAFAANGGLLASGSWDNTVKLWDVQTKHEVVTLNGHENFVASVAFTSDGRLLATASWDKTVKLWDVQRKQEVAVLKQREFYT
jgi:WD40 repeat protein